MARPKSSKLEYILPGENTVRTSLLVDEKLFKRFTDAIHANGMTIRYVLNNAIMEYLARCETFGTAADDERENERA